MLLTLHIILVWLVVGIFIILPNKIERESLLFVFMVSTIVILLTSSALYINLKLIVLSQEPALFLSYLLYRNILLPFLITICVTVIFSNNRIGTKVITITIISASVILIQRLDVTFGMMTFHHWSYFLDFSLFIVYFIISLLLTKIFRYFLNRERMTE